MSDNQRGRGPLRPKTNEDMFIGWSPNPPSVDRRFLLGLGIGAVIAGGGVAGALAAFQQAPGEGTWDQGDTRDFVGELITHPYPALRVGAQLETDGGLREVRAFARPSLLGCVGKCGVHERLAAAERASQSGYVAVRGTLIERGDDTMISAIDGPDWVRSVDPRELNGQPLGLRARAEAVELGRVTLRGEILDAKCWFGAMRPNQGKVHKACAALCIRSGLPPAFFARLRTGAVRAFVLTDDRPGQSGGPLRDEILARVADPVRVPGRIVQSDFTEFRIDPADITVV